MLRFQPTVAPRVIADRVGTLSLSLVDAVHAQEVGVGHVGRREDPFADDIPVCPTGRPLDHQPEQDVGAVVVSTALAGGEIRRSMDELG